MEIKRRDAGSGVAGLLASLPARLVGSRIRILMLLSAVIVATAAATLVAVGLAQERLSRSDRARYEKYYAAFVRRPFVYPIGNYVHGKLAKADKIYLDIDYESSRRLAYWRAEALAKGTLYGVDHGSVNAEIRSENETIPVKVRLKGGGAKDHLGGDKQSLRIRVRGERSLLGMKEFSLMDPQRRNFLLEWFLRVVAAEEGIVSKRYRFVRLFVNGTDKGVYALDEHHGKTVLEANRRREGPIIRLVQEPLWYEAAAWYLRDSQRDDYYFAAEVDAIGETEADTQSQEVLRRAMTSYEAFRAGEKTTSEVFDVPLLARWLALGDVFGAWHGFGVFNMRFYYNPVTARLEPIPDDTFNEHQTDPGREKIFRLNDQYMKGKFLHQAFSDLELTEAYLAELERVTDHAYLGDLLSRHEDAIRRNLAILHRDVPLYEFPEDQLYANQRALREILNPARGIAAFLEEEAASAIELQLAVLKTIPMTVLGLRIGDRFLEPTGGVTTLPGREYAAPLRFHRLRFSFPQGVLASSPAAELTLEYRLLGTSRRRSEPVTRRPAYRASASAGIGWAPNPQAFEFLEIDAEGAEIAVRPGDWRIAEPLTLPRGFTVTVPAGTVLDLTAGAAIVSFSPVRFLGTEKDPIRLTSSDSTGQGLAVLEAGEGSVLEHVTFENLAAPSRDGWYLTGAVTFYESSVQVSSCRFVASRSEDALNVIRSRFLVHDSLFSGSASDALDIDFSDGQLLESSFVESGNDAIDLSGSEARFFDVFVNGAGDKGISVGESSRVRIERAELRNCNVGIASKDLSEVRVEGLALADSRVGLAVYEKKPEFGPGSMTVLETQLAAVDLVHIVEEGSSLAVDGRRIPAGARNVARALEK